MTDTITGGSAYAWVDGYYVEAETTFTIEPTLILGYKSSRETRNRLHPILGSSETDVTLRPSARRKGTLELGFAGATAEADSLFAEEALASAGTFALNSSDRGSVEMAFTVTGEISRELEPTTRKSWVVAFDYQEVAP